MRVDRVWSRFGHTLCYDYYIGSIRAVAPRGVGQLQGDTHTMSATPTRWVINVEYDFETEREVVEYEHTDVCKDRHCIGECNEAASNVEEPEGEDELFSYSSESAPAPSVNGAFAALAGLEVK